MDSGRSFFPNFSTRRDPQKYGDDANAASSFNANHPTYQETPRYLSSSIGFRQTADEVLDLAQYEDGARDTANDLSLDDVIKPEHAQPWSGTHSDAQARPHWHESDWHSSSTYARSEPPPKQDPYYDATDSGYGRSINSNFARQSNPPAGYPCDAAEGQSIVSDSRLCGLPRDGRRKQIVPRCNYLGCNKQPKNPSDAKKHELTHTKPFHCGEHGCPRQDGFATDNDLQRHRKSVHGLTPTIGAGMGYICVLCTLAEGDTPKFWPRRDNFKAHIKRKHPSHAMEWVLDASKQDMRPDDAVTVQSTMDSALRHSQVDPDESSQYNFMGMCSSLPRQLSDQGAYQNSLWPDASMENSTEETLVSMQGHTVDMLYQQSPTAPSHHSGADVLSFTAHQSTYPVDMMATSPFKKPKLDTFHHDPRHNSQQPPQIHLTIPDFSSASGGSRTSSIHSALSPTSGQGEFICPVCRKRTKRDCDMKKHMKRHTRPYGCTHSHCQKKFGSRNDWRRHETSQHFLQEMWKCEHALVDGSRCTHRPFQRQEELEQHLRRPKHGLRDAEEIAQACNAYRLGREGHGRYWCGFCKKLISQPPGVQNAWDERFKHIGDHFDKGNCDSGDWVCIEENRMKKYITPGSHKDGRRRVRMDAGSGEDADLDVYTPEMSSYTAQGMLAPRSYGTDVNGMFAPSSPNKRKHEGDDDDNRNDVFFV